MIVILRAVGDLESAGIARSTSMALVGHETESIYLRYAIASETDLSDAAMKLAAFFDKSEPTEAALKIAS